jgi:glycosidase
MDFPIQDALNLSLTKDDGWMHLYETLAMDFLYANPNDLVVFADNHDTERFFSRVGENFSKFKLGIAYILTTRGIPQIYYGTEILSTGGVGNEDWGYKRKDFPGGWAGDPINAFTGKGLTAQQKAAQAYVRKLVNWRKSNDIVEHGKLMHFIPHDNIYVYFRYNDKGTVMVILNKNTEGKSLSTQRFAEIMKGFTSGHDVISGEDLTDLSTITVPAMSPMIIELKK